MAKHWSIVAWALVLAFFWFSSPNELTAAVPPARTQVAIVGAGLSGLATAYYLRKAHIPYHLIELNDRVGGRVRTVEYERSGIQIRADAGMEEYWASNPASQILKELKLPLISDVAPSSIVIQSHLYPLDTESIPDFFQKIFSKSEFEEFQKFQTKVEPMIRVLQPNRNLPDALLKLKDISLAEYIRDQRLPSKVSEWIRISLECEIGTSWDKISALDGIAEFHVFLGNGENCYRVKGGNFKFVESMAKAVGLHHISLHQRVTKVAERKDGIEIHYIDMLSNENRTLKANYVVLTIPLFHLKTIQFDPPLSEKKWKAVQTMGHGSYFKAHLFVPPSAQHFWMRGSGSILPILSDSKIGVIYEGNPNAGNHTRVITLLVHGDWAEKLNHFSMDQVRTEIFDGLEKFWPGFTKEILDAEFYPYADGAIASWPVGRSRFDSLSNEIRRPEHGIYLAGDFTETSHSDGAFISAERVSSQIIHESQRMEAASHR